MKYLLFPLLPFLLCSFFIKDHPSSLPAAPSSVQDSIPVLFKGQFADDYDIRYTITDSVWIQHPNARYHILKWNTGEQYIIARNDEANPSEKGLYSRIDYMQFNSMEPWLWGFCLTIYNAKSDSLAEVQAVADRKNPRKGCNGYPFSRMRQVPR
jgi:hypothetical protein